MRYMKTVDLHDVRVAYMVRTGQIKLQCGQWVQCGDGPKSRFHYLNRETGYIRAFHGPNASKKFHEYVNAMREANNALAQAGYQRAADTMGHQGRGQVAPSEPETV